MKNLIYREGREDRKGEDFSLRPSRWKAFFFGGWPTVVEARLPEVVIKSNAER